MSERPKQIAKHVCYDVYAGGGPKGESKYYPPFLNLFTTSGEIEGAFSPAAHILINGEEGVRNLRDLCNELLGEKAS